MALPLHEKMRRETDDADPPMTEPGSLRMETAMACPTPPFDIRGCPGASAEQNGAVATGGHRSMMIRRHARHRELPCAGRRRFTRRQARQVNT